MAQGKFVAYYRVSTAKQGASGLGLDAQKEAVRSYLNGGRWRMVDEVVEVESGKRTDRPELARALALCRVHGATLIIAKLDRLARNVHFISGLMESGVEFIAVDMPAANRLTVHILSAVAEHEAKMISQRTKAALAAAKARGVRLGCRHRKIAAQAAVGAQASAVARRAKAQNRAADLLPVIRSIQAEGASSLRAVATTLNEKGVPSPSGGAWHGNSVRRVVELDC
ncbi:recombinase family protein [Edaphobacter sp. 12200R-103]|uniref:recombinase family protein n=1 Tax=Edaphobacter sp. 12200R-103 TaxID=2703788 RepID=UPI00138C6C95|nr:recombinase family protein [Edaphobacter sp. 12200R-103]QHS51723.1 recombinase family protein [Edaphobacter sp. 12200R-103]